MLFRYEVRAWRGGVIPYIADAVDGPTVVSRDQEKAVDILELAAHIPNFTWGRDAVGAR